MLFGRRRLEIPSTLAGNLVALRGLTFAIFLVNAVTISLLGQIRSLREHLVLVHGAVTALVGADKSRPGFTSPYPMSELSQELQ